MHSDVDDTRDSIGDTQTRAMAQRLQSLPSELQPPFDWVEFQRRSREHSARSLHPVRRQHVAAAAGLAVLVASIALWSRLTPSGFPSSGTPDSRLELPTVTAVESRATVAQAEASEQWLAALPAEPAIVRVQTHLAVADLEDRIAWMDDVLSAERVEGAPAARLMALQDQRARLVNSLAHVRYAETVAAAVP